MFSVLITTFVQILHDLRVFIVVLLIIMAGFGLGLKILLKTPDEINNFQIVETIYYMMFGLVDLDFLKPEKPEKPNIATMAFTLVGAFMFIVVIVLLNMLIALMGDSYDNVTENIQIESIRARARVCADLLIDVGTNDNIFCEWLHVCVAKDENTFSNRSTWEGKLKAMKREIGGVKKEVKKEVKKDIDGVKKEIDGVKKVLLMEEYRSTASMAKIRYMAKRPTLRLKASTAWTKARMPLRMQFPAFLFVISSA